MAQILGLTLAQLRAWLRAGFLDPARDETGAFRFTMGDLVLLRTAKGLAAQVPARKLRNALRRLREQLPVGRPLTGIRITAVGDAIVAREGEDSWQPESGQRLFDFAVSDLGTRVAPHARRAAARARDDEDALDADGWYALGCDLEVGAPEQARDAYRRALERDPSHVDARVNLGRLLHSAGHAELAATHYRLALSSDPRHAVASFNLGVALDDLGRAAEAVAAYETALRLDPHLADAHSNLARLHERAGDKAAAIRHLSAYRRLLRGPRRA